MRCRINRKRKGTATVEFAVCVPVMLIVGLGLINVGFLVQFRANSKMVGHLAASELFQAKSDNSNLIEQKYENLASNLGIRGMDVEIRQFSPDIAVVTTHVSVTENSAIPSTFLTARNLSVNTYVFAQNVD